MAREPLVATYSIVGCDLEARQWGVAVQSKFLAVGALCPFAEAEVGAVATQSFVNPRYGPDGLALLREGLSAEEAVERLTAADEGRGQRQLGIVDREGRAATYTGERCFAWAGGRTGAGYAAQGNILVGEETVDALAATLDATTDLPLVQRLIECLGAAQAAGGDRRGPRRPPRAARARPRAAGRRGGAGGGWSAEEAAGGGGRPKSAMSMRV